MKMLLLLARSDEPAKKEKYVKPARNQYVSSLRTLLASLWWREAKTRNTSVFVSWYVSR